MYKFDKTILSDFKKASSIEFFMPNGLGGYVSSTAINNTYKKHNSYLTHSFNPPVERYVLLSKINERLTIGNDSYSFASSEHKDYITTGNKYLSSFEYNYIPTYTYEVNNVKVIKKISPYYNHNACAISYKIINNTENQVALDLIPLFNDKFLGESQNCEIRFKERKTKYGYTLKNDKLSIYYKFNLGQIIKRDKASQYINELYPRFDVETGDERLDYSYTPITHQIICEKHTTVNVSVVVSTEVIKKDAFKIIEEYDKRIKSIARRANLDDDFATNLAISGDSFICHRKSTGLKTILAGLPWFTDWGRDTMIAFTGLLLVPQRFEDAREVLLSFSKYEKNGLIPNMFPSNNEDPLYNTVDASLWYFYACYKYILYTGDYDFIINEIMPTLKNIIKYYKEGTDFNIHMDTDGLIIAGSDLDQITWMDVRVGEFVVTPRHGKPVEINALWYNALKIMELLCEHNNEDSSSYSTLAQKVKDSFNKRYFNEETNCLYDVLDENDPSVRPNQLYAISLPFKILDKEAAKKIVEVCKAELYVKYGIRSLSYKDPRFKPKYEGKLWDRDMAYHMGTSWGFIVGAYIDSYAYVNDYSDESLNELLNVVKEYQTHMNEYCLNGIAEIFDGLEPDCSRGCSNQAWSIGELLRAYYENLMVRGYKIK
jgi:predicted glycogen debranching enzyme